MMHTAIEHSRFALYVHGVPEHTLMVQTLQTSWMPQFAGLTTGPAVLYLQACLKLFWITVDLVLVRNPTLPQSSC
jgi:hypothetical protein